MTRLYTLGCFELVGNPTAEAPPIVIQPKRLALLAYLAVATPRGFHRRDTLLALLWPNLGQQEGRRALRQALHYLRKQLGDDAIVTLPDDRVGLARGAIDCDVIAMEDAMAANRCEDALDLYGGPFLDGVFVPEVTLEFDEWVEAMRRRVAATAALAAWAVSDAHEARGDGTAAIAAGRRAHDLTPNDERGLRRLLELMRRFSDRAGVLQAYQEFEQRLHAELGGCPSSQTLRIVREVRDPGAGRGGERLATRRSGEVPVMPVHRDQQLDTPARGVS